MPILIGFALAALFAAIAFAVGTLTRDGAAAATVVGGVALAAGWTWALLLLTFFIGSSVLSHIGPRRYERAGLKEGPRDAAQVLANGSIPAVAAIAHLLGLPGPWAMVYVAALATANADTWATEIGRYSRSNPRLITTGRAVSPGVSGGVTGAGTVGAVAGAAVVGAAGALSGLLPPGDAARIACAGIAGALADSVLGATVQERRFCPNCGVTTEQKCHDACGSSTQVVGGVVGVDNDAVNLLAGAIGALAGLVLLAGR